MLTLTPLGVTPLEAVSALAAWAAGHRSDIQADRGEYDERQATLESMSAG